MSFNGFEPQIAPRKPDRFIPASEWWDEIIERMDDEHTRKSLVLAGANKDGGTHVDEKLPPAYASIKKPGALGTFENLSSNGPQPVENTHVMLLRAMAAEVLSNPDLLALGT